MTINSNRIRILAAAEATSRTAPHRAATIRACTSASEVKARWATLKVSRVVAAIWATNRCTTWEAEGQTTTWVEAKKVASTTDTIRISTASTAIRRSSTIHMEAVRYSSISHSSRKLSKTNPRKAKRISREIIRKGSNSSSTINTIVTTNSTTKPQVITTTQTPILSRVLNSTMATTRCLQMVNPTASRTSSSKTIIRTTTIHPRPRRLP